MLEPQEIGITANLLPKGVFGILLDIPVANRQGLHGVPLSSRSSLVPVMCSELLRLVEA
jgi:hypothetical protein